MATGSVIKSKESMSAQINMGFYALVALLPVVAVMTFLVVLRWSAVQAMPVAYGITFR